MNINRNLASKAPQSANKAKAAPNSECGCPHSHSAPAESVDLSRASDPKFEPPEQEPPQQPPADPNIAKVDVFTQDPYVEGSVTKDIPRNEVTDLQSERVKIRDKREHAKPDSQGNYIFAEDSDGISQMTALVYTTDTLQAFEDYRGSEIPWATRGDQLSVTPHKQEGRNAYYSRWGGGTNYFFSDSPGLGTVMKTANSAEVVAHETGHAMLDGIRPGYFGTHDDETGAFHEAFGDCAAMLMTLRDPNNLDTIMDQSGGSLRNHNALSSLAEEFGAARAFDNDDPADDHKIWLRTALNQFTYVDPSELPPGRGGDDHMGREVHSFSRLFSAAFYDAIESVYMQSIYDDKQCPKEALQTAEQVTGPLLMRAVEAGSTSQARFKEVALGMITADGAINGGKYSEGLKKVFLDRKIITPEDLEASEARLASVPDLTLPEGLSKANAVNFLEDNAAALKIPADLPYIPDGVSTNERGETFVSFRYKQEVPVTVKGLEDKVTDVQGGINLVFDAEGKLTDKVHTEITPETIANEMAGIERMQSKNAIIEKEALQLFKSSGNEMLFKSQIDGNKLVRIPISGCNHDHGPGGHHHH